MTASDYGTSSNRTSTGEQAPGERPSKGHVERVMLGTARVRGDEPPLRNRRAAPGQEKAPVRSLTGVRCKTSGICLVWAAAQHALAHVFVVLIDTRETAVQLPCAIGGANQSNAHTAAGTRCYLLPSKSVELARRPWTRRPVWHSETILDHLAIHRECETAQSPSHGIDSEANRRSVSPANGGMTAPYRTRLPGVISVETINRIHSNDYCRAPVLVDICRQGIS